MLQRLFLMLVLSAFSLAALGQSLDMNLSNDTAQIRLNVFPAGSTRFGETQVNLGLLYTTDEDYVGTAGLMVVGETGSGSPGLDAGVGVQLFGGTTEKDNDFLAVTISGLLRYSPPALDRLKLGVYIDYSPKIVTFIDGDNFINYGVRVGYEVLQQAQIYVGYRKMDLDASGRNSDDTIDSGGHIGLEFYF